MQPYNNIPKQLRPATQHELKVTGPRSQLHLLFALVFLALVSLACGFLGSGSRPASGPIVIDTHLPTLTRTPLPTLTPTSMATPVAVAAALEPADAAPTLAPTGPTTELESAPATPAAEPTLASDTADVSAVDQSSGPIDTVTAGEPISIPTPVTPVDTGAQPASPTDTPTVAATTLPPPTDTPTATATEMFPTSTPTATPTETPLPADWLFSNVQVYPDESEGGLLLYGNVVNNTGALQELLSVTGTFHDAQGQVIADEEDTYFYSPTYFIPVGGTVPFELMVEGVQSAADYELRVEAEPSSDTPRQDFEFSDVNQWTEDDIYCVEGKLGNRGGGLQKYIAIAAILYDSQNNVVNFSDYVEYGPGDVVGDETLDFVICIDPPNQDVARYDLVAWGL